MARNYDSFVSRSPGAASDLEAPVGRRAFVVRYICFEVAGTVLGYLLYFLILFISAQLWPTVEARETSACRTYNLLAWIPVLAFVILAIRLKNRWVIRPRLLDAGENPRIAWMSYIPLLALLPMIVCLAKPTKSA